jgi:hypothetical protein
MKKSIFVELIFLKIYGGRPSTDFSVLKPDIEAYLPAAVNYALTKSFYIQKNTERNGDIPTDFYHTFTNLPILKDSTRNNRKYVNMPATLVSMPGNNGIRMVMDNCETVYTPLGDAQLANIDYWLNIMTSEKFYNLSGKKLYIFNSGIVEKLKLTMIVTPAELSDDEELPIPAGLENEAIDMAYEFVTGIRSTPVDRKIDTRDLN